MGRARSQLKVALQGESQGHKYPDFSPPPLLYLQLWFPIDQTQPEATVQENALRKRNATFDIGHGPGLGVLLGNTSHFMERQHQRALCHYDGSRQKQDQQQSCLNIEKNTNTVQNTTKTKHPPVLAVSDDAPLPVPALASV